MKTLDLVAPKQNPKHLIIKNLREQLRKKKRDVLNHYMEKNQKV